MNIFKYEFSVEDRVEIPTHKLEKILHFDTRVQNKVAGRLCMWAIVNPDTGPDHDLHTFYVVGTGHPMPFDKSLEHLATVMDGPYVWHIFREVPK